MATLVLDSSIALAWFLPGEGTLETEDLLDRVVNSGALVPSLWPWEVGNVLLIAERKNRISSPQRLRTIAALSRLPIEIEMRSSNQIWDGVFDLAKKHALTLYDAAYLDLSLQTGLPLATLDVELRLAADACGVQKLGLAGD